jgi:hypothetical protein
MFIGGGEVNHPIDIYDISTVTDLVNTTVNEFYGIDNTNNLDLFKIQYTSNGTRTPIFMYS